MTTKSQNRERTFNDLYRTLKQQIGFAESHGDLELENLLMKMLLDVQKKSKLMAQFEDQNA